MTLRKYLAGIALLFAIPGVILLAMSSGIAWAFLIIAGFMGIGAFSACNATQEQESKLDDAWDENTWATHPFNPASPTYEDRI